MIPQIGSVWSGPSKDCIGEHYVVLTVRAAKTSNKILNKGDLIAVLRNGHRQVEVPVSKLFSGEDYTPCFDSEGKQLTAQTV